MCTTVAPFVLDISSSPFHAQHLTPRELHNFRHGDFVAAGRAGTYRGAPQFTWWCTACYERSCVRTASSMFKSRETRCGCTRVGTPERAEHQLLRTRFGELLVTGVAHLGRMPAFECTCLCGRRGADAERRGQRVIVTERALREGAVWACLPCMERRAAAGPVPAAWRAA